MTWAIFGGNRSQAYIKFTFGRFFAFLLTSQVDVVQSWSHLGLVPIEKGWGRRTLADEGEANTGGGRPHWG